VTNKFLEALRRTPPVSELTWANMKRHSRMMVAVILMLERSLESPQKLLIAFATQESLNYTWQWAFDHFQSELFTYKHETKEIHVENGSVVYFQAPSCPLGIDVTHVWIDELVDDNMAVHLKTRERL